MGIRNKSNKVSPKVNISINIDTGCSGEYSLNILAITVSTLAILFRKLVRKEDLFLVSEMFSESMKE